MTTNAGSETTVATPTPSKKAKTRSVSAIVFDLFLLAFVGTLVGISLSSLGPSARLVPLIVGVPTLLGIAALLLLDLFPGLRKSGSEPPDEADGKEVGEPDPASTPVEQTAGGAGTGELAMEEAEEEGKPEESQEARKREVIFALWAVGFFVLAAIFGLLVSIPIALFVFFKVLNREGWVLTLAMTAGTWLFIYVLFGVVLGVRF